MFKLGIENLLNDHQLLAELKGKRVGFVGHPASVDQQLNHSLDLLHGQLGNSLTCAFGPARPRALHNRDRQRLGTLCPQRQGS